MNHLERLPDAVRIPLFNTDGVGMAHVRSIVKEVYDLHLPENFKKIGIDIIYGSPRSSTTTGWRQNGKTVSAEKILVSTVLQPPAVPPVEGIQDVLYLTNSTVFSIDRLPRSLLVLGAVPSG